MDPEYKPKNLSSNVIDLFESAVERNYKGTSIDPNKVITKILNI